MPVQNRPPCRLRPTAGSGPRLWRGAGDLVRARPRQRGRAPAAGPQPPFGRQTQPFLVYTVPPTLHGCAGGDGPPAASAFGVRILSVHSVRLRCCRLGFLAGGQALRGLSARCPPGRSRFAKARGRRAGRHADEGRQRRCPARRQPGGTLRPGRSASFRLVKRGPPFLPRRASRPIPGRDRRARDPRGAGPLGPSAPGRRFSLAAKSEGTAPVEEVRGNGGAHPCDAPGRAFLRFAPKGKPHECELKLFWTAMMKDDEQPRWWLRRMACTSRLSPSLCETV